EDARFLVVPPHWKCERDPWGYSTANASSLIERATASNAHRSEFLLDESGRGKLPPGTPRFSNRPTATRHRRATAAAPQAGLSRRRGVAVHFTRTRQPPTTTYP